MKTISIQDLYRPDLLQADIQVVADAMKFMSKPERDVLVALATSYQQEREDKPTSEVFQLWAETAC